MAEISGNLIHRAFENAMDATMPRTSTESGILVHQISYHSLGRLAGQMHTSRAGNTIQTSGQTYYWQWWLNGRGAVQPVNAKFLHYFVGGREVFSKYSKPFAGHRETIEPKYAEKVAQILDNQLTRFFGSL